MVLRFVQGRLSHVLRSAPKWSLAAPGYRLGLPPFFSGVFPPPDVSTLRVARCRFAWTHPGPPRGKTPEKKGGRNERSERRPTEFLCGSAAIDMEAGEGSRAAPMRCCTANRLPPGRHGGSPP